MLDFQAAVKEAVKEYGAAEFSEALKKQDMTEAEVTPATIAMTLKGLHEFAKGEDFTSKFEDFSLLVAAKLIKQLPA